MDCGFCLHTPPPRTHTHTLKCWLSMKPSCWSDDYFRTTGAGGELLASS